MSFAWDITISAATTAADPKKQTLKVAFGILTKVEFKFPRGCHGMVKAKLLKGDLFRVTPNNPDEWITGDNESVIYQTYLPMLDIPNELQFYGCSPDTSYDHVVTIRLTVLPRMVASFIPIIEAINKLFQRIGVI